MSTQHTTKRELKRELAISVTAIAQLTKKKTLSEDEKSTLKQHIENASVCERRLEMHK